MIIANFFFALAIVASETPRFLAISSARRSLPPASRASLATRELWTNKDWPKCCQFF
jgi:hypothetical protein